MAERASFEEFVAAQDRVWPAVIAELTAGRKQSHWMWFVFPQLAVLGRSGMAKRFGIDGLLDAQSYLAHPVLGPRLRQVTELVLAQPGVTPEEMLGGVDAMKLRSCMTLFEVADGTNSPFSSVLEAFYAGVRCPLTLAAIKR